MSNKTREGRVHPKTLGVDKVRCQPPQGTGQCGCPRKSPDANLSVGLDVRTPFPPSIRRTAIPHADYMGLNANALRQSSSDAGDRVSETARRIGQVCGQKGNFHR